MERLAEMAGFFGAHGVWCVADGGPLIPLVGYATGGGERQMRRFYAPELEQATDAARTFLKENPERSTRAVFVYDGFVTLATGKLDALILDARVYDAGSLLVAIPYRPAAGDQPFAVHRPKFMNLEPESTEIELLVQAFFRGVGAHSEGAAVWDKHLDETV